MDLKMAPMTANRDANSRNPTFFTYIQRMRRMSKPSFTNPCVWLWVHNFEEQAKQSVDFVKRFLPEYNFLHSMYRASKNKCLDDTKTQAPLTFVFLLFLFKRGDGHASCLLQNMMKEFTVPVDVSYYSNIGRYMEVKYHIYASELQMEFYFELLNLFYKANENIIGIHYNAKFMLTAKVCFKVSLKYQNIDRRVLAQNMDFSGM